MQCGGIGKTSSIYNHQVFDFCQRALNYTDTEPSTPNKYLANRIRKRYCTESLKKLVNIYENIWKTC